jgi:hypothetical protein
MPQPGWLLCSIGKSVGACESTSTRVGSAVSCTWIASAFAIAACSAEQRISRVLGRTYSQPDDA